MGFWTKIGLIFASKAALNAIANAAEKNEAVTKLKKLREEDGDEKTDQLWDKIVNLTQHKLHEKARKLAIEKLNDITLLREIYISCPATKEGKLLYKKMPTSMFAERVLKDREQLFYDKENPFDYEDVIGYTDEIGTAWYYYCNRIGEDSSEYGVHHHGPNKDRINDKFKKFMVAFQKTPEKFVSLDEWNNIKYSEYQKTLSEKERADENGDVYMKWESTIWPQMVLENGWDRQFTLNINTEYQEKIRARLDQPSKKFVDQYHIDTPVLIKDKPSTSSEIQEAVRILESWSNPEL